MTKRLFDIIVAACTLLLVSPLILLGALAVKLDTPGPIFYRAKRAGVGARPFLMFKLRTMRIGLDTSERRVTADNDDRITRSGVFLRRLRIDELPQFWNVLRGDMSIVGPRPEDLGIVESYYGPEQRKVLSVRPGVASPADVRWYPDHTYHDPPPVGVPIQEYYVQRHLPVKLAEEAAYVEHHNLLIDLKVMLQTLYCVLVYSWKPPKKQPVSSIALEPAQSQSS